MQPFEFYVDLTPLTSKRPKITVSQFDVGRPFLAHITYLGKTYEIPSDAMVSLLVRKPSGFLFTTEVSFDGDAVYFETAEQMTPEAGTAECEISIIGDGNVPIGSANFDMIAEKSVTEGGIASDSEISEIQRAIDAGNQAAVSAAAANASKESAGQAAQASQAAAALSADSEEKAAQAKEKAEAARDLAREYADQAGTIVNYGNVTAIINAAGHLELNATMETV